MSKYQQLQQEDHLNSSSFTNSAEKAGICNANLIKEYHHLSQVKQNLLQTKSGLEADLSGVQRTG